MNILVFHLLNDFSGSPKVLSQIISGLLTKRHDISLITSKGGILDTLNHKNLKVHHFYYNFFSNKLITFLIFTYAQLATFFLGLKYGRKGFFYINTILPFGATIAAKIRRRPIIYHYHENAAAKGLFYKFLSKIMLICADKIICVSKDQASTLPKSDKIIVLPNAIPKSFETIENLNLEDAFRKKSVLMLCSLKRYKGINEFWRLAELLPQFNFEIVINDSDSNIEKYIIENQLKNLPNLVWFSKQSDVLKFYLRCAIVLNLSNKEEFIETFGLTAIEAIACGRPIIGPTVGGISEIIEDGYNGYKIDSQDLNKLKTTIQYILSTEAIYKNFCNNALTLKYKYSEKNIIEKINDIICSI